MDQEEWESCLDIEEMLVALWAAARGDEAPLVRALHRFYMESALRLGPLQPQGDSRQGLEAGMRFLRGEIDQDELGHANWYCEGAAFRIDYDDGDPEVARWVDAVAALAPEELQTLVPNGDLEAMDARQWLLDAAYFADFAMMFPFISPSSGRDQRVVVPPSKHLKFLSADRFRDAFPTAPVA